jgi:hypothetical protein
MITHKVTAFVDRPCAAMLHSGYQGQRRPPNSGVFHITIDLKLLHPLATDWL